MFDLRTLVILMISLTIAIAAGWLTVRTGQPPAAGILAGGAAFGGTLVLLDKFVR
ncbi:hypothetical protein [Nocardia terpenica]|uniref:Uncharacterized protein n=1 Tax=Nocardia terpenica TaxID=455432 RepID=A0A6G9YZR9_9NOCA|nr:hypothetical protein [Nocardia terpenica]QIS18738.1 hypothetical protein F6W96_10995 [Nocardia terpenica]